jgi:hypothetical protein
LTEVSVNVLEPDPLEVVEDMVKLVAVMVNPGVAASAGKPAKTKLAVKSSSRRTGARQQRIAESFPRVAYTLPEWLDGG